MLEFCVSCKLLLLIMHRLESISSACLAVFGHNVLGISLEVSTTALFIRIKKIKSCLHPTLCLATRLTRYYLTLRPLLATRYHPTLRLTKMYHLTLRLLTRSPIILALRPARGQLNFRFRAGLSLLKTTLTKTTCNGLELFQNQQAIPQTPLLKGRVKEKFYRLRPLKFPRHTLPRAKMLQISMVFRT